MTRMFFFPVCLGALPELDSFPTRRNIRGLHSEDLMVGSVHLGAARYVICLALLRSFLSRNEMRRKNKTWHWPYLTTLLTMTSRLRYFLFELFKRSLKLGDPVR